MSQKRWFTEAVMVCGLAAFRAEPRTPPCRGCPSHQQLPRKGPEGWLGSSFTMGWPKLSPKRKFSLCRYLLIHRARCRGLQKT